jgi:hypothetical protein
MHNSKNIKIVVYVPETDAGFVREAMSKAGAGKLGNLGANPHIGKI